MTRDELDLEAEHLTLLEELADAKAAGDRERLAAAKAAIFTFRTKWRTVRAAFAPQPGEARPDTLATGIEVVS